MDCLERLERTRMSSAAAAVAPGAESSRWLRKSEARGGGLRHVI